MEANDILRLKNAPNLRDLGGTAIEGGRSLRKRLLYRSEALHTLDAAEVDMLRELGIRLACDLRSQVEREDFPSRWPQDSAPEILTSAGHELVGAADLRRLLRETSYRSIAQARSYMENIYRGFPSAFAATLAHLFEHLVGERGPVLIHCMAGKDRTGYVCAMLLMALGASRETAKADYLLSNLYFGAERISGMLKSRHVDSEPDPECVEALCVRPEYFDAMLASVESEHGSVDRYLEVVTGLTPRRREALRQATLA